MEVLLNVTVTFCLVLALSMIIERILEILKTLYDLIDSRFNWHVAWTKKAQKIKSTMIKKISVFEYSSRQKALSAIKRYSEMLLGTGEGYTGSALVISGDLVRTLHIKVISKIFGIAIGIALAFWLDIDIVALWSPDLPVINSFVDKILYAKTMHLTLSGIAMGLGSGPVHKLITAIEKSNKNKII